MVGKSEYEIGIMSRPRLSNPELDFRAYKKVLCPQWLVPDEVPLSMEMSTETNCHNDKRFFVKYQPNPTFVGH